MFNTLYLSIGVHMLCYLSKSLHCLFEDHVFVSVWDLQVLLCELQTSLSWVQHKENVRRYNVFMQGPLLFQTDQESMLSYMDSFLLGSWLALLSLTACAIVEYYHWVLLRKLHSDRVKACRIFLIFSVEKFAKWKHIF